MHPVIAAAAAGRLPDWAEASDERRAHMGRVADVMAGWAAAFGLDADDVTRWRAAAMLHDTLRDADPDALRPEAPDPFRALPGGMLHGPVAAARLQEDGVDDDPILDAVRWHTLGHPDLDRLGRALYIADYTEPGRRKDRGRRAALRARVPDELDTVLREVVASKIRRTLELEGTLQTATVAFWNDVVSP